MVDSLDDTIADEGTVVSAIDFSVLSDDLDYAVLTPESISLTVYDNDDFRINTYTNNHQSSPTIASNSTSTVVVWTSVGQDGDGYGIFGQRFDSTGNPVGPEFQINTYTTDDQGGPAVFMDSVGNFMVVWQSWAQDGDVYGIFGQRFDSNGNPVGSEFQINTYTTGGQQYPAVAMDSTGNFLVVWMSYGQDGNYWGIFGRRFDSAGNPLGPEFQINTNATNDQVYHAVAMDPIGNFVVLWQSVGQDGDSWGVFGQLFDPAGNPVGPEFQINTYTTNDQSRPAVALDSAGNFVVVWMSQDQDGNGFGIFGQRFDPAGNPLGAEFQINTYTVNAQRFPALVMDSGGNSIVIWTSMDQDGSGDGIYGRRFTASGEAACTGQ